MNRYAATRLRTLELKADRLWQEAVMLKWGGRCAIWKWEPASCGHHIIKRRCKETRHELMNGIALSQRVHAWAESHPEAFLERLKKDYPLMYAWNQMNLNPPIRVWYPDMVQMKIDKLKQEIEDML